MAPRRGDAIVRVPSFLWLAFGVLSVVAFFAILLTGRYPRGSFGFNVGMLRWSWRTSTCPTGSRRVCWAASS